MSNYDNYGMPYDAVFHAEATLLMRASRNNDGSLAGLSFDAYADREMCISCRRLLPLLAQELGNPKVTFESPTGAKRTMHSGEWVDWGMPFGKRIYFDRFDRPGWPHPLELEPFFLAPKGQQWSYRGGNDGWGLMLEGVDGTGLFKIGESRIDIHLDMWGHPELGVLLIYRKWGGGYKDTYNSKGDLSRLKEHVRSLHGTLLPVGLFIPFEVAWKAVKEFIETDGKLPKSIAWIENSKLPPGTFPVP